MRVRAVVDLPKVGGKYLEGLKVGDEGVVTSFRLRSGAWAVRFYPDRYVFVRENEVEIVNEF